MLEEKKKDFWKQLFLQKNHPKSESHTCSQTKVNMFWNSLPMERAMVFEWCQLWACLPGKREQASAEGDKEGKGKRTSCWHACPNVYRRCMEGHPIKVSAGNFLPTSVLTFWACNDYLSSICFIEDNISFVFPSKEDIASVFCCNEHSAFCKNKWIDIPGNTF